MGDAINEDTRPRAPVVWAPANPALTSKMSLKSPASIHRRNSLVDPERKALTVPKPRARSRMPTVRIINGIEEPDGTVLSQRKNRVGDPPNASPAQSRTPPMAMTTARTRLSLIVGVPTQISGTDASRETQTTDQDSSRQVARLGDVRASADRQAWRATH
jgi:hypothetical protein